MKRKVIKKIIENEEEFIVAKLHQNWIAYSKPLFLGIVLTPVFGLGLIILLKTFIQRKAKKYIITNKKIVLENGILSKVRDIIPMQNIRTIRVKQSALDRILNHGTVILSVPGGAKDGVPIARISKPDQLIETINSYRS